MGISDSRSYPNSGSGLPHFGEVTDVGVKQVVNLVPLCEVTGVTGFHETVHSFDWTILDLLDRADVFSWPSILTNCENSPLSLLRVEIWESLATSGDRWIRSLCGRSFGPEPILAGSGLAIVGCMMGRPSNVVSCEPEVRYRSKMDTKV